MASTKQVYGLLFPKHLDPLAVEFQMCRWGGRWEDKKGKTYGEGMFFHFKRAMQLMWPDVVWHKWNNLIVEKYCDPAVRTIAILGPASCVGGETRIRNPVTGQNPTIRELCESNSTTWVMTQQGPSPAGVPFVKGFSPMFLVTLSDGRQFRATGHHRVLTEDGYKFVSDLRIGQPLPSYDELPSQSIADTCQSAWLEDDPSFWRTVEGSGCDCPACRRSGGEPLPALKGTCQGVFPSLDDAPVRNGPRTLKRWDDPGNTPAHNHLCQSAFLPSIGYSATLSDCRETFVSPRSFSGTPRLDASLCRLLFQFVSGSSRHGSFETPWHDDACRQQFVSSVKYTVQRNLVANIKPVGADYFYDLCVPDVHHYFAEGAIHHNSGKTHSSALCGLTDYFIRPENTMLLVCSTTKELLEQRVWGEIKTLWKRAKRLHNWLPGNLIEGRLRIVTDSRIENWDENEGRDMRAGAMGIPCKKGTDYVGIGDFAGNKATFMRVIGDELSLLPPAFIHAISNLDKNPSLKVIGLGNPKDTMDALGMLAEPAPHLGGWDGNIDQTPGTKTWETRRGGGICIQLPGDDSPNLDGKLGCPLITQEAIDRDISFYGTDSVWYSMMDMGRMPRGQGSRRVLTRQMCHKFHAMDEPNWLDGNRTKIGFLDAAYGGTGGDRCIFGEIQFGREAEILDAGYALEAVINQGTLSTRRRTVMALIDTILVPVSTQLKDLPCDQIVNFCRQQCEARGIPPENFFYESGMRAALVQAFARLWSTTTNALDCMGTASPDKKVSADIDVWCKDYYANKITEMWYAVPHIVEAGQFRGMKEGPLLEFCQREWGYVGKNKIQVEPKTEMKKKTGRSPDEADAVVIGVTGAIQRGFVIERLKSVRQVVRDDKWKRLIKEKASVLWRGKELNHAA